MLRRNHYSSKRRIKIIGAKTLLCLYTFIGFTLAAGDISQAQDFTWTFRAPMPHGKGGVCGTAVGSIIYTFAGHTEPWTWPYGRICEAYNTTTNSWFRTADLPHGDGRYNMAAVAVGGKIYTVAGTNIGGNYNTSNIDVYNPATDTWIPNKATLPISISGVGLAACNGKIYIIGGGFYRTYDQDSANVYEYDPASNILKQKASMPTPRTFPFAVTVGNRIYVMGGYSYDHDTDLNVVEVYDPVANQWTTGYPPVPKSGTVGGAVINNRIYVNVFNTTSVYEYNPSTNSWSSKNPIQTTRSGQCVTAVGNKLYVMGGFIPGHITSSVEEGVLEAATVPIDIDIKPGSCPNPLNIKAKGLLSVAILGTSDFDVFDIDPASIRLEGLPPARSSYEDVASPVRNRNSECDCTTEGPDGYLDLVMKFDAQAVIAALGAIYDGDTLLLTLTGEDTNGTPMEGTDCVMIITK